MGDRRNNVPFDPYYFEKLDREGITLTVANTFRRIYRENHWKGEESVSGEGANSAQTAVLEAQLPILIEQLDVNTLLDLPCGDFSWMQRVDLPGVTYIGADIVPELIAENQKRYGREQRQFVTLDLIEDPLPEADLLLCRDGFVHFSLADIFRAFANIKRSQLEYVLMTTFPGCKKNEDITTGDWRVLNVERPPFNLPPPIRCIQEDCTEGGGQFRDKSLGVWRVSTLPTGPETGSSCQYAQH